MIAPDVIPQPIQPPHLQATAGPEAFGGGVGLEQAGKANFDLTQEAGKIAGFEQIRADQTASEQAIADMAAYHTHLLTDPTSGLPSYQGTRALEGQKVLTEQFQKKANEIVAAIPSPVARGIAAKQILTMGNAFDEHVNAYTTNELEKQHGAVFEAFVSNRTNAASLDYGSAGAVSTAHNDIMTTANSRADTLGYTPDQKEKFLREINDHFHYSVLSQMAGDPNFVKQGQEYLDQNKDGMSVGAVQMAQNLFDTLPKQRAESDKKAQEDAYKANFKQALDATLKGDMTLSEAQRLFLNGKLDKADFQAIETRVKDPIKYAENLQETSDPAYFNQIRQSMLNRSATPGELGRMILDPRIKTQDASYLKNLISEMPPSSRDTQIEAVANNIRNFGNQYFAETNFLGHPTNQDETNKKTDVLVSSFYRQVDGTKADSEKMKEIADNLKRTAAMQRYPGIGNYKSMPDIVIDIKGQVHRLLSPDDKSTLKPKYKFTPTESQKPDDE